LTQTFHVSQHSTPVQVTLMQIHWYFYLVRCRDGSLYAGSTNDLKRRVDQHNAGRGGRYTSSHRPVELAYAERYLTPSVSKTVDCVSIPARQKSQSYADPRSMVSPAPSWRVTVEVLSS
jgi:predicted GIY-YIG superfamily endonuclease